MNCATVSEPVKILQVHVDGEIVDTFILDGTEGIDPDPGKYYIEPGVYLLIEVTNMKSLIL